MSGIVGQNLGRGSGLVKSGAVVADSVTGASIADDSIDSEHYVDASIDNEHLADDAVGVAELSATGTASSSTFLRGDNSWAAAGGGKVLQVINKIDGTYQATSSSTFADTSLSQAFTPSATSSKVLIMCEHQCMKSSGNTGVKLRLLRDSTTLGQFITIGGETEESTRNDFGSACFFYLDSPNTTSAVTYKTQMANYVNGTGGARVNGSGSDQSSMVLMEILA